MCDCFDSYPTFFNQKQVTARKPYKCCECRSPISEGDRYLRSDGLWDGKFSSYHTCTECMNLANFIRHKFPEETECMAFQELYEILWQLDGVLPSDDELYANEPETLKIYRHSIIASLVPWLKRINGKWRLVEVAA